jgi:hypothetical protein
VRILVWVVENYRLGYSVPPPPTEGSYTMHIKEVLCVGTNLDGSPCTRHRKMGALTCAHHHPERIEARVAVLEEQAANLRRSQVEA